MQKTELATRKRGLLGRMAEMEVLEYLERHPGSTTYDISKGLSWTAGKVQGCLKRLEDDLKVEEIVEGGRLKKKFYVKKIEDFLDFSKF
jgi:DNA-binding MarR family transcriptional regulator